MLKNLCCMRLRTAGIMIGWLGIVSAILGLTSICGLFIYTSLVVRNGDLQSTSIGKLLISEEMHGYAFIIYSSCFGVSLLHLFASGMLVLGTVKHRHWMLLPWLVNTSIGIFVMCLSAITPFFLMLATTDRLTFAALFMGQLLLLAFALLIFNVIYSLYKEIKLANNQKELSAMQPITPAMQPYPDSIYPNLDKF